MPWKSLFISLTLLTTINIYSQPAPHFHWENSQWINNGWLYLEKDSLEKFPLDDSGYVEIALPHTWNATDVLEAKDYRRGSSWYRKYFYFSADDLSQRHYLRFHAAGQQAKVFFNGALLTHHIGGYSAFTIELDETKHEGRNQIDVWVSNLNDQQVAPLSGDFNFYGGLYRGVEMLSTDKVAFSRTETGGPGVKVWSRKVSHSHADLYIQALIDNGSEKEVKLTLKSTLLDKNGIAVTSGNQKLTVEAGKEIKIKYELPEIETPQLWSPESPSLYTCKLELLYKGKVIDKIEQKHGFRWFEFTANKGFFLNGEPYKLKGINRHQDYYREGNALPLPRHLDDIKLIKDLGVNWLRLAHYQQDDYVLQLCDELGILVWEEIPWVNNTSFDATFEYNLQSMMKDLINQHYNHPSIILWGLGNEVWIKDDGKGRANIYEILDNLNKLAHMEDPVRQTVFVSSDNNRAIDLQVWQVPDVFGYNLYRGWYNTHHSTFTDRVNELHSMMPGKPLIISEFGAGSDTSIHTNIPLKQDFSIEYQNDFLLSHLDQIDKIDWLCGANWWSFADFGAAHRGDSKPHINQKGLVTYDRKKKDAFYILKSRWSDEPVVYIESPYRTDRSGNPQKKYRVFTNMDSVEFFLNDTPLGKQADGFIWNAPLLEGENTLLAKASSGASEKEHGFNVSYSKKNYAYNVIADTSVDNSKPEYIIDGNPLTYWDSQFENWIQLDLNQLRLVDGVKIHFFTDNAPTYNLEILVSKDGINWISQFKGKSNPYAEIETFMFEEQQEMRYLKVVGHGSNRTSHNRYREIVPVISSEKKNEF